MAVIDEFIYTENGVSESKEDIDGKPIDLIHIDTGKNLFDDTLEEGYISSNGEDIYSVQNIKNTKIISVPADVTLSFDLNIKIGKIAFCYYEDGVFTRRVETYTSQNKLTTSLQGNENGIRFYITSVEPIVLSDITNVQIEVGTNVTEYEPFGGKDYHFAKETEVTNGSCEDAVEEPIIDMQISGNSVQNILPDEYQQVEYIEGTGTQYISIDYIASSITKAKGRFQITNIEKAGFIFGSRSPSTDLAYTLNWGGGLPYKYYNSYRVMFLTTKEIDNEVHTFYKNKNELYVDGELLNTATEADFVTPQKMSIFACNNGDSVGYYPAMVKLFNLQFYDEEELKIDLIPCYRKSDNEIGLYDLVNEVFYTNLGTGEFLKGNNAPTPEAPIEIESVGDKTNNLMPNTFNRISSAYVTQEEDGWLNIDCDNTNGTESLYLNFWYSKNEKLISGETYTFVLEIKEVENVPTITISQQTTTESSQFNTKIVADNIVENSIRFITVTCNNATDGEYLSRSFFSVNNGVHKKVKLRLSLLKGTITESNYEGYEPYDKYKVPVKVKNNLYNPNTIVNGMYITSSGDEVTTTNLFRTDYFPVLSNEEYILKCSTTHSSNIVSFAWYDINKTFISRSSSSQITGEIEFKAVAPSNAEYAICNIINDSTNILITGKPVITNIYLNEPLRKIGDYADYIDYKNKKVVRSIKEATFTGNEGWVLDSMGLSYERVRLSLGLVYKTVYCNVGVHSDASWNETTFSVQADNEGNIRFYRPFYAGIITTEATLGNWKAYLSERYANGNPIVLDYAIPTPTEEAIEIPEISTFKGTNIFDIDTSIKPSEIKVNYWKQI